MIHTNELMLGNWVEYATGINGDKRSIPMYVVAIDEEEALLSFEGNETGPLIIEQERLRGIPITEELLDKCGFDKGPGFLYQIGFDTFITVQVFPDFTRLHFKGIVFGDFRFLHELQNAYFMLTKKHLDIKL